MEMNGTTIRARTFRTRLRGDDHAEVAAFLGEVAAEVDRLRAENEEFSRRASELERRLEDFQSVEQALRQSLTRAQEEGPRAVEQARREAGLIIQDAELKAGQIVDRSRSDLTALKEQITILGARKDSILSRLKMLLHSELELVRALETDEDLRRAPTDPSAPAGERSSPEIDEILRGLDRE